MSAHPTAAAGPYAFVESLTADEALMFATYVAGLSPDAFARAAALIERDRAIGDDLPDDVPDAPELMPPAPHPTSRRELPAEAVRAIAAIRQFAGPTLPPVPVPVEMPAQLPAAVPDVPQGVPAAVDQGVPSGGPQLVAVPDLPEPREVYERAVAEFVAPDGRFRRRPSIRALKRVLRCGQDRASEVREYLTEYVAS